MFHVKHIFLKKSFSKILKKSLTQLNNYDTISMYKGGNRMKAYVVYGEESGEIKNFKTLKEAKEFLKELKKFDKKQGIEDKYYIEIEEW